MSESDGRLNSALLRSPLATMAAASLIWWRIAYIATDELKQWAKTKPQP